MQRFILGFIAALLTICFFIQLDKIHIIQFYKQQSDLKSANIEIERQGILNKILISELTDKNKKLKEYDKMVKLLNYISSVSKEARSILIQHLNDKE